jgi:hypothetical protein
MTDLYLTSPTLILARMGTDYPELDDTTLEILAYDAETDVYGYTGIYPTITEKTTKQHLQSHTDLQHPTATLTIDNTTTNTLTLTIDGVDDVYDLTAAANDTLAELVAVLDAIDGIICTIDADATTDQDSAGLQDLAAVDIKATVQTAEYMPYDPDEVCPDEITWSTDVITYRLMVGAANAFATSAALAKVLGIDISATNYKIALLEVQKDSASRNLLKMVFYYRNIAKEMLDKISSTPKRRRRAYLVSPNTSTATADYYPYLG